MRCGHRYPGIRRDLYWRNARDGAWRDIRRRITVGGATGSIPQHADTSIGTRCGRTPLGRSADRIYLARWVGAASAKSTSRSCS
jgi:hypothetical protein